MPAINPTVINTNRATLLRLMPLRVPRGWTGLPQSWQGPGDVEMDPQVRLVQLYSCISSGIKEIEGRGRRPNRVDF